MHDVKKTLFVEVEMGNKKSNPCIISLNQKEKKKFLPEAVDFAS